MTSGGNIKIAKRFIYTAAACYLIAAASGSLGYKAAALTALIFGLIFTVAIWTADLPKSEKYDDEEAEWMNAIK